MASCNGLWHKYCFNVSVKPTFEPAHQARAYPGFHSMKHFLMPLGLDEMLVHHRVTPDIKIFHHMAVLIYTPG